MTYPQQPPYAQPAPQPQFVATRKKSNAWKWVLGILGLCVLLCGGGAVACTALFAGGVKNAVDEHESKASARAAENSKSCEGKKYPDQQPDNDRCADSANQVVLESVAVTATPLSRNADKLCSSVTYENKSNKTVSFNVFDWKLQLPSGEVKDAWDGIGANDPLGSGDLVTGGKKTGTLCYPASGGGQHILIYKPSAWSSSRGIWVNVISG